MVSESLIQQSSTSLVKVELRGSDDSEIVLIFQF
jgi:hypothetical protein